MPTCERCGKGPTETHQPWRQMEDSFWICPDCYADASGKAPNRGDLLFKAFNNFAGVSLPLWLVFGACVGALETYIPPSAHDAGYLQAVVNNLLAAAGVAWLFAIAFLYILWGMLIGLWGVWSHQTGRYSEPSKKPGPSGAYNAPETPQGSSPTGGVL